MKRALVTVMLLALEGTALARVGFGDPAEAYREHKSGEILELRGHMRVRSAFYNNLDLSARPSPSGQVLWPRGDGPLNTTVGSDMRVRLSPSIWWGDDVRLFLEVDLLDNVAFGSTPKGTPYNGQPGIVAGTAFQDPLSTAAGAFRIRTAVAEAFTPLGIISAGRSPTHWGLGIAANSGDDIDDDGGDRADRIAWMMPLLGHYVAAAFDISASGPRGNHNVVGPNPTSPLLSQQAISLAFLRWRAPWEVDMHRRAKGWLIDYGLATSVQFQARDNPVFYQALQPSPGLNQNETVRRDYFGAIADGWIRFWWRDLRVEAEAVVSQVYMGNASPYPGIEFRKPVFGNPFGGVLVAEWLPMRGKFGLLGETGVASADPSPGFPQADAAGLVGAQPGDLRSPQVDGVHDTRFDSFRFHPMYRVDLIMWRTLLGGVSEAAYVRGKVSFAPIDGIRWEFSSIYSHALLAGSAPGNANPLGVEFDSALTARMGAFSLRTDMGVLVPLPGLVERRPNTPPVAHMLMVRLAYAR